MIVTARADSFDNYTSEPTLTQLVVQKVRDAMQKNLGLRQAGETQADAIVRGSITRYDADLPTAYSGTGNGQVTVTQRQVQITLNIEITNQHTGKVLWQRQGLPVEGSYTPPQEADGRDKALDKLVTQIVEGAQSQW